MTDAELELARLRSMTAAMDAVTAALAPRPVRKAWSSRTEVWFTVGEANFRADVTITQRKPWRTDDDTVEVEDIYLLSADGKSAVVLPDFLASKVADEAQEAADADHWGAP